MYIILISDVKLNEKRGLTIVQGQLAKNSLNFEENRNKKIVYIFRLLL